MVVISAAIGVAFQALAKIKKPVWNAMKGAFQSVKSAVNPLENMGKILMFLGPIIRLFGALFTILGAAIMQAAMPAIQALITAFTDPEFIQNLVNLGTQIGNLIVALLTPRFIATLVELVKGVIDLATALLTPGFINTLVSLVYQIVNLAVAVLTPNFISELVDLVIQIINLVSAILTPGFVIGVTNLVGGLVGLATIITSAMKPVIDWIATLNPSEIARLFYIVGLGIATILGMQTGGWIGGLIAAAAWAIGMSGLLSYHKGTPYVPQTGAYILEQGEAVISRRDNRGRGEIHIHIDLRNAVVDNVDNLSQKIAEQVLIQIG